MRNKMITKIVECGNIREFQLCLCQRERFETAILCYDEYPQSRYTPGYTLRCWDGIMSQSIPSVTIPPPRATPGHQAKTRARPPGI